MPPPSRNEQPILLNPDEQNIRKLLRIRIRQIVICAVLETCLNIGMELDRLEDEEYDLIWPVYDFFPSISWEMLMQEQDSQPCCHFAINKQLIDK